MARWMGKRASAEESLLLLLVLLLAAAAGQDAASTPPPDQSRKSQATSKPAPPKADPELQAILDGAATAPPEFGADVMIRLAESSKILNSARKVELLSKAFDLATGAEQPVKRAGVAGGVGDLRNGLAVRAYRLNLDKLSLQSRAVTDLLPLNAAKARARFEEIQFPTLTPLGCEERLGYDVALFYEALGKVVSSSFSAKEKEKGRQIALLMPFVSTLQSHAQIGPAADLLVNAKLSTSDLGQLANAFAASLAQLRGDERSFAASVIGPGGASVPEAMSGLMAALEEREVSHVALLRAYRQYLVSNLGDVRCSVTRGQFDRDQSETDRLPFSVTAFNKRFQKELQTAQIAPITADELKNARIIPAPPVQRYWQSPEAKRLQTDMRKLRFGSGDDDPETASDKPSSSAPSQVTDFLTELEAWQPQDQLAADVFHQKTTLYENLIDLVASGPSQAQAIDSFVMLIEQYSGQLPSRIEWFLPADDLLSGKRAADAREQVIQAFVSSGDPVLSLYARLERWDPRKPQTKGSEQGPGR